MSNIQITENGSGKYSPEWFYSESQTPEWISFAPCVVDPSNDIKSCIFPTLRRRGTETVGNSEVRVEKGQIAV